MPPAGQTARRNPLSHELGVGCNSSSALQRRRCRPLPAGGSQDFDPESAAPNPKPHAPSAAAAVRAGREHGRKAKRARGQRRGGGSSHGAAVLEVILRHSIRCRSGGARLSAAGGEGDLLGRLQWQIPAASTLPARHASQRTRHLGQPSSYAQSPATHGCRRRLSEAALSGLLIGDFCREEKANAKDDPV